MGPQSLRRSCLLTLLGLVLGLVGGGAAWVLIKLIALITNVALLHQVGWELPSFEHYVDDNMRNIPDHYHAHARPKGGFFGHGLKRKTT